MAASKFKMADLWHHWHVMTRCNLQIISPIKPRQNRVNSDAVSQHRCPWYFVIIPKKQIHSTFSLESYRRQGNTRPSVFSWVVCFTYRENNCILGIGWYFSDLHCYKIENKIKRLSLNNHRFVIKFSLLSIEIKLVNGLPYSPAQPFIGPVTCLVEERNTWRAQWR